MKECKTLYIRADDGSLMKVADFHKEGCEHVSTVLG
jgi:hypothetical protein